MPNKPGRVSVPVANTAAILGKPAVRKTAGLTTCIVCLKEIPTPRLEALKSLNTQPDRWTCIKCSTVTKVKGLYLGEVGTSQLQLCNRVYNDSVRSVFRGAEAEGSADGDTPEDDN